MTTPAPPEALILTARMETVAFERFDSQRRTFFPPERNFLSAHITLFHHLPGEELQEVTTRLGEIAARTPALTVEVTGLRFLGRGVAYHLSSSRLEAVRASLAADWRGWLTHQDRSGFKPHVTVQNKVAPAEARETLALLGARFSPWSFTVTGLELWRYLGGPWEPLETYLFQGK